MPFVIFTSIYNFPVIIVSPRTELPGINTVLLACEPLHHYSDNGDACEDSNSDDIEQKESESKSLVEGVVIEMIKPFFSLHQ